jgi:hypothetical protein
MRAAAEHGAETVPTIRGGIASRHDVPTRSHDLTSTPRSLVRGRTERTVGRWTTTHAEPAIWRRSATRLGGPESVFSGTVKLAYPIGSDDEACRSSWSLTDVPDGWSRDDVPFTAVIDRVETAVAQAAPVAGDGIVGNRCG